MIEYKRHSTRQLKYVAARCATKAFQCYLCRIVRASGAWLSGCCSSVVMY